MPRSGDPGGIRPHFFDRSPSQEVISDLRVLQENDSFATVASYTVPTAHKAALTSLALVSIVTVAFTTSTASDRYRVAVQMIPSGGSTRNITRIYGMSIDAVRDDYRHVEMCGPIMMYDGDEVRLVAGAEGDAAGAGRVEMVVSATISEFSE